MDQVLAVETQASVERLSNVQQTGSCNGKTGTWARLQVQCGERVSANGATVWSRFCGRSEY